jgi:hypothetical protein
VHQRRRRGTALVLVALAAWCMLAIGSTGRAGTTPTARLELGAQDPWTPLGGDAHLQVRIQDPAPDLEVSVTAHQALTSRAAFSRAVSGGSLGSVLDEVETPLDALVADGAGLRTLTLGLEAPSGSRTADRLGIRRQGVYPLTVELRNDVGQTLAELTTYLVAVDAGASGATPLEQRLGVAWVWPMSAAPATLPGGSLDPGVMATLRPSGRLGRQAAALRRNADVAVTIAPGPETMQVWASAAHDDPAVADGAAAVQDAATRGQLLSSPYVPVDLPSLLAGGLLGAIDSQLVVGDQTLARLFDAGPDPRTALARPVDPASLSRLRGAAVERVLVDGSSLVDDGDRGAPERPFLLEPAASVAPTSPVSALAGDGQLTSLLDGGDSPALRAQRFLAGLSVIALESPDDARAVTIINPDGFDPSQELLDAVFAGLRANPWLQPMTTAGVFEGIAPETSANGTATARTLAPYDPPRSPVTAPAYDATQTRLNSFRSLVPPDDDRVVLAQQSLLASVSSAWNVPGGLIRANEQLGSVDASIDSFLAQIHVPEPSTITLTSSAGEIPLTFRNDSGQIVSVLIELQSPKLDFPEGSARLVDLPPRSTTVRFAVESRTSGSFPLRLSVRSADGVLPITDSSFRVRSTAVSVAGLVLMIGAGAFLAVWWGWDIRRRRVRARA